MKKIPAQNGFVFESRDSVFGYHAWPSIAVAPGGELFAVCSGLRLSHLCPFGKVLLSRSRDSGKTWTRPQIVIDTPLDDRDAGITFFGDGKMIVTSFNHPVERQKGFPCSEDYAESMKNAYFAFDRVNSGNTQKYLGSTYVLSNDGGLTFSDVKIAPVTAPHGPSRMLDGSLLYVGNSYMNANSGAIEFHKSTDGESWEFLSKITCDDDAMLLCEPWALQLADGRIICHIRIQYRNAPSVGGVFCVWQYESSDGGKTWSGPRRLNDHGSPPHILQHSSGALVCVYGYRREPYGQRLIISRDGAKTWSEEYILRDDGPFHDLGYPCSAELGDGRIITVYYQQRESGRQCEIMSSIWSLDDLD